MVCHALRPKKREGLSDPLNVGTKMDEVKYWKSIEHKTNKADFEEFISRFPQGEFIDLARLRLQELQRQGKR